MLDSLCYFIDPYALDLERFCLWTANQGMSDDLDPYSVLGIDRGCDQEALKKRYQVLAKEVCS